MIRTGRETKEQNKIHYNTIQYNTIEYNIIQYITVQYNKKHYNTIQYNTIQYNTLQYNAMQYCTYVVGISWAIAIMYCTSKLASAQIFNPLHIGVICSPTDDEGETVWYRGIDMSHSDREKVRTKRETLKMS